MIFKKLLNIRQRFDLKKISYISYKILFKYLRLYNYFMNEENLGKYQSRIIIL